MDRRMIYLFSLIAFFLMWGVFGFAAATPRSEPAVEATVAPVESTLVLPDSAFVQKDIVCLLIRGIGG